ncbi:hypothetical protein SLS59_001148 [Nothophoma quercina]|uniref:Major facilitator superfamily (MFS) profile domain-containing protein n=1 Tax=Nothophoma quercina TaxID=749835 RepID=A0ABR3RYY0_9PLEO
MKPNTVDTATSASTEPLAKNITSQETQNAPPEFNEQTHYVPVKTIITASSNSYDLLALMDQTTLAASLTTITKDLGASSESAWISGAYFLTSTSFQLLYGRLSDVWSRKVLLVIGIGIFFVGSLAASLAKSSLQLIIFRAFTGVGGGGLMTVAQLIVSDIVPLRERGKYQGILGSVVALANGIGPVVGGALASQSHDSWRWIFRLNLFLSVLTTACVFFFMPLKQVHGGWKKKLAAIDFFGVVLALAVNVFKSRVVNGATLTMFINGWNFLVQVYYIPSFYQLIYGFSAVKSGALLLPITLTQTLFSTLSGLIVHKTGRYRECLLVGWAVWAVGLGLISTLDQPSLGKQIGYGLLAGFGLGNTLQPSLIAVQAGVERKHMAVVTSFRNFTRNLGGTLGLAISGTIINNAVRAALVPYGLSRSDIQLLLDSPERFQEDSGEQRTELLRVALSSAYQKGFKIVFIVGAVLNALAFGAAWFLMPHIELARADDEILKEEGKKWDAEKNREKEQA